VLYETPKGCVPSASDKVLYVFYDFVPGKLRGTLARYPVSSPCDSSFRSVKMWNTAANGCDAVSGSTRSGTILWGSGDYTYVRHALVPKRTSRLRTTPRRSTYNSF